MPSAKLASAISSTSASRGHHRRCPAGREEGGPRRLADPRQAEHSAADLGALKVIGRTGQEDAAAERATLEMGLDLRHFVTTEQGARVGLDLRCEPIAGAKWAVPQRGDGECRRDSRREDHRPVHDTRSSSCQPISRRWKPSAKSIASTAR